MSKLDLEQNRVQHLGALWDSTRLTCPNLSTFYLLKQKETEEKDGSYNPVTYNKCCFCNSPFLPGNHRVRLLPRSKLTPRIRKLLQKNADNPRSLGKFQNKLVQDYTEGRNRVAITCFSCKKTVKLPGQSRQERQQQKELFRSESSQPCSDKIEQLKSRKEKKKQKKKQMRINKKEGRSSDINAGLILDKVLLTGTGRTKESGLTLNADTVVLSTQSPAAPPSTSVNKSTNHNLDKKNISLVDKQMDKLRGTSLTSKQSDKSKTVISSSTSKVHKPNVKKKKSKMMSRQLGNILKQEQNKPSGGSLADFLSTI